MVNLLSPTGALLLLLIMYVRYQNIPYKSNLSREKSSRISKVTLVWTFGRYLKGAIDLYEKFSVNENLAYTQNIQEASVKSAVLFLIALLLAEILCYLVVMDYGFMKIFLFH